MKRFLHILKNIFVFMVVIFAISMMTFTIVSVTALDKTDRNLFGYKAFIVLTDSMSATDFKAGDLVITKEIDPKTLKVGDIISYRSINIDHYYEVVTHKISKLTVDKYGRPGFITYGTTTGTEDEEIVFYENVLGKYKFRLAGVGTFFQFLKTTPGYIICILTPFLLLIFIQAIHSIHLFRKYKEETINEMDQEKKKLELEKLETENIKKQLANSEERTRMIEKELKDLKAELSRRKSPSSIKKKESTRQKKDSKMTTEKKAKTIKDDKKLKSKTTKKKEEKKTPSKKKTTTTSKTKVSAIKTDKKTTKKGVSKK